MKKVSILIPARNEPYLQRTVDDLFKKAKGEIEVIVVLDGWWPTPILRDNPNLILIHRGVAQGMRPAINSAASISKGDYLLKCDAHCMFDEGYDEKLKADCGADWTVVPVRFGLDVQKWRRTDEFHEFQYIKRDTLKGRDWPEYAERVNGQMVVDLMTSQGSCWFMHRQRFFDLGGLDDINYGTMGREAQEVCLKAWLSGGRYVLNRNTWYAHWSKPSIDYPGRSVERAKSIEYATHVWKQNLWPMQTRKLAWLVDKFAPVPTW